MDQRALCFIIVDLYFCDVCRRIFRKRGMKYKDVSLH